MTCIVAVVEGSKVYMGADTYGAGYNSGSYISNPKCFINGEFLIGCTTSFRLIDLLAYKLNVNKVHPDEQKDADKYMRTIFVDSVRETLKTGGLLEVHNSKEEGGNFLVGYAGKLYEIQNDFSVLNVPDYGTSVGSGENAARGSLHTSRELTWTPKERLSAALEAAVEVVPSVRGPFVYLDN